MMGYKELPGDLQPFFIKCQITIPFILLQAISDGYGRMNLNEQRQLKARLTEPDLQKRVLIAVNEAATALMLTAN